MTRFERLCRDVARAGGRGCSDVSWWTVPLPVGVKDVLRGMELNVVGKKPSHK